MYTNTKLIIEKKRVTSLNLLFTINVVAVSRISLSKFTYISSPSYTMATLYLPCRPTLIFLLTNINGVMVYWQAGQISTNGQRPASDIFELVYMFGVTRLRHFVMNYDLLTMGYKPFFVMSWTNLPRV